MGLSGFAAGGDGVGCLSRGEMRLCLNCFSLGGMFALRQWRADFGFGEGWLVGKDEWARLFSQGALFLSTRQRMPTL